MTPPPPLRPRFSARLPFRAADNALARAVRAYRRSQASLLDLTESNPTRAGLAAPPGALANVVAGVSPADLSAYAPEPRGLRSAREAVAADYARRGAAVDPDAIVLTASTSEAYAWLFALLTDPGDAVLVPEPSYPLFEYLTRLAGVRPRGYRLTLDGDRWALDVDSLVSAARGLRVRAVVVVAPNNPTGSSPDAAEWDALTRLCAGQGATLVVDEVFADYAPGGPITAATRQADVLTFTLGGLSKSAGLPQAKVAWIGAHGPGATVQAALAALDLVADTYLPVPGLLQHALPGLLEVGAGVRARIQARVRDNREHLQARLGSGSAVSVLPGPGCWSAVLRLPALRRGEEWALTLLEDAGVLVHPGYFFDLAEGEHLVPSVLPEPAAFQEAVSRLLGMVEAAVRV